MRYVAAFASHQILLECSNKGEASEGGMWPIGGRRKEHTEFWCGYMKEIRRFDNLGVNGRIILKWILKK
jgi:hypothetical protein